jgi:hypothetical protein
MLKSIRLKFGPTPDAAPLQFTPGPMTMFVGPHGAGKSLALDELRRSLCRAEADDRDRRILADIEPGLPPSGERRDRVLAIIRTDLERLRTVNATDSAILNTLVKVLRDPEVEPETLDEAISWLDATGKRQIVEALIERRKLRPLVHSRTSPAAELLPTFTLIQALTERGDERLIADGLIDLRGYHQIHGEPCLSLDDEALLALAADGRSQDGYGHILGDRQFIMVDDPEATLQPSLARQLGLDLGRLCAERGAQMFAATESPDFVAGCVESGQELTIVRLGFHDGRASALLLPPASFESRAIASRAGRNDCD